MATMRVSDVVGGVAVKKRYDNYALMVLSDYFETLPAEQGKEGRRLPPKYRIKKDLPTIEEYHQQRNKKFTTNVDSLVDEAFSEIESLAEEMRSWYDNLTEGLQQTSKAEEINEAADTLEGIDRIDCPESADGIEVLRLPGLNVNSRSDRASDAQDMLTCAFEAVNDRVGELQDERDQKSGGEEKDELENRIQELESYSEELERAADEVGNVSFPGMY